MSSNQTSEQKLVQLINDATHHFYERLTTNPANHPSMEEYILMQKNHRDVAHIAHLHDDSKIRSDAFCTCKCCATPLLKKGYLMTQDHSMICATCFLLPTKQY